MISIILFKDREKRRKIFGKSGKLFPLYSGL
jgi:hypothetical protein